MVICTSDVERTATSFFLYKFSHGSKGCEWLRFKRLQQMPQHVKKKVCRVWCRKLPLIVFGAVLLSRVVKATAKATNVVSFWGVFLPPTALRHWGLRFSLIWKVCPVLGLRPALRPGVERKWYQVSRGWKSFGFEFFTRFHTLFSTVHVCLKGQGKVHKVFGSFSSVFRC